MKKLLKILLALVLIVVLAAAGYVAYLFIDYERIPDMQEIHADATRDIKPPMAAGEEYSIVTWNVGFGAYGDDFSFFMDGGTESWAESPEAVLEHMAFVSSELQRMDADLMLVQEVDVDSTRAYHIDQSEILRAAFPDYRCVFIQNYNSSFLPYPFHQPHGASRSGLLTLSNVEMEGTIRRSLPIETGINKFFDLDRCYAVTRIPVDNGKTLCLYNLHLSAYTSDGSIATEQLVMMAGDMRADYEAGNYVIAGGDFNKDLWGDSAAYTGIPGEGASWCKPFPTEVLPGGFELVSSLNPEKLVLSCRDTGAPYEKGVTFEVTLDGFIVSDNVEVIACEVVDEGFKASDHNPVRMEFTLN